MFEIGSNFDFCGNFKIVKSENEDYPCYGCEFPECDESLKIQVGCKIGKDRVIFKKNI